MNTIPVYRVHSCILQYIAINNTAAYSECIVVYYYYTKIEKRIECLVVVITESDWNASNCAAVVISLAQHKCQRGIIHLIIITIGIWSIYFQLFFLTRMIKCIVCQSSPVSSWLLYIKWSTAMDEKRSSLFKMW